MKKNHQKGTSSSTTIIHFQGRTGFGCLFQRGSFSYLYLQSDGGLHLETPKNSLPLLQASSKYDTKQKKLSMHLYKGNCLKCTINLHCLITPRKIRYNLMTLSGKHQEKTELKSDLPPCLVRDGSAQAGGQHVQRHWGSGSGTGTENCN